MTEHGPFIVAKISNAPDTESIRKKITEGIIKGFSVGGRAKRVKEYSHELGKDINRVITKRISEISIVDLPANPDSFFNVLKSACIGDQCKIESEEMDIKPAKTEEIANEADGLKSVEDEIAKIERENDGLRKQIAELQSSTESEKESEEVVMKNTNTDNTIGGKSMEQDENIVRFEPAELKDFIKGTMDDYAKESEIIEKADDYDRLLSEMKDLRSKIEGLEAKVKSQAAALKAQPQTTMKSEDTDESETDDTEKAETESDDVQKMEALEARLKSVEESPLYKATQDGEDMDEKDKKKTKKGHLANVIGESFGGK
jgi:chromosome segregation ATPase